MKVVAFCDSDDAKKWTRYIRSAGFKLTTITGDDLSVIAGGLTGRRAPRRSSDAKTLQVVDRADVLLIGADVGAVFDGERLAYLARCYSACKAIVIVDRYHPGFDLDMTGHPESFADVHVSSEDLRNPRLWRSPAKAGFRPWNWPVLTDLVAKFKRRVEFLSTRMDSPMLAGLGFSDNEAANRFSYAALAFLSPTRGYDDFGSLTFREFTVRSGNGLREVDAARGIDEAALLRITAARVSRWLEDHVLSGQNALVDAPHLVSRMFSLYRGDTTLAGLARITAIPGGTSPRGVVRALGLAPVAAESMMDPFWTSRPAWFWSETQGLRDRFPWRDFPTEIAFCEDISAFRHRNATRRIVTAVNSANVRTQVSTLKGVTHWPMVRFLT